MENKGLPLIERIRETDEEVQERIRVESAVLRAKADSLKSERGIKEGMLWLLRKKFPHKGHSRLYKGNGIKKVYILAESDYFWGKSETDPQFSEPFDESIAGKLENRGWYCTQGLDLGYEENNGGDI